MYFKIMKNDMLKSKMITLTITLFIATAAMLVSLAAVLVIHLFGALNTLMTKAETPHFMQMHTGELEMSRLTSFAQQNSDVHQFQVAEFLNINGEQIILGDNSLADSVQDNGVSVQNEQFDFLLDLEGNVIQVADGQLYVPLTYMRDATTKIGDKAFINGQEFTVVGFLRDSQMNATLSGSKRFLVSENDFEQLSSSGSIEYLIEFRLKDLSKLSEFETAYASSGLEANGPTLTYNLFKMINALSDGMMIAVIVLLSVIVVIISFMCIRFTLLAKIEDDYREIGVMKAIGMRISDIKKMYLTKYVGMSVLAIAIGLGLSNILKGMFLENIRLYFGESSNQYLAVLIEIVCVLLLFSIIVIYVNSVLNHIKKISAAKVLRTGFSDEKNASTKRFTLSRNRLFHTNIFLGLQDVLVRKKLYSTMLIVLVLASFMMIVPQNLYNTISSKSFSEYMGIGNYDMRIDLQQLPNIAEKAADISEEMSNDRAISKYAVLTTKVFNVKMENGSDENIKVELGDHSIFPIQYVNGAAPDKDNEIALSSLNAEAMNKSVGDMLTLVIEGEEKELKVSGIYSDITNGGKTAKAKFKDESASILWSVICAKIIDPTLVDGKVSAYMDMFKFAKISDVEEYVGQTFGSTIQSVDVVAKAALVIALGITVLILLLFMKLLLAKDKYAITVMKTLGFSNTDIKVQYVARALCIAIVGIILGAILSNTLGEMLTGLVISSFGASSFKFEVHIINTYLLIPLVMICTVLIATMIGTLNVKGIKNVENLKG